MDEERRKEFWATLALRHCPGLGVRSQIRLLTEYGSALKAFEAFKSWQKIGIGERIVHEMNRESWRQRAMEEWKKVGEMSTDFVLWSDFSYPQQLKNLPDAPILLYFRGDFSLFKSPGIALVGSRNSSANGLDVAAYLARSLSASGIAIISGMASGIDSTAHMFALREVGSTIGVLGTGIDIVYPRTNKKLFDQVAKNGLLISEFAPGTPPFAANFPIRNRIISGLSLGVVVVEAARKSGSLITAKCALEQNREVFAVPGQAFNSHCIGCQDLVRQGAKAVFNADDILKDLSELLKSYNLISPPEDFQDIIENALSHDNESKRANLNCNFSNGRKTSAPKNPNAKLLRKTEKHSVPECDIASSLVSDDQAEQIVGLLNSQGCMHIDAISDKLGIDIENLNSMILGLEMLGIITRLPGSRIQIGHE